ncbi:hypothetical protein BBP40_010913 [Aspergillus hancockii]|nr:hypothetical protein BBP40_010913 [Aspergillus hancockii]
MSPSLDNQAMDQLQSQQLKLLDKIDELRAIGVGGLVELPQLIVCGNQSSGKSSVLEAISRVRFPAKSNVCTRFATEVVLRRNAQSKIKVSIEPGVSRTNEQERQNLRSFTGDASPDGIDLPALIEKAKTCMGINDGDSVNSGFSDDVLKVEISGPDKPELTLVDLPGLYYSTSREQGSRGIGIVRGLTEKYMKNTRSIILAVISAKTDYHLQEVLNMAERFDPKRERTLGIITQPDILEAGSAEESNYLQFMRNEKIRLQLGWHALRNRSFETRDISDDARDEKEKEFFQQGRWALVARDCLGVETLRRRLSSVLLRHVQRSLPGLIEDIREKIADRQQSLLKLGSTRSTLQQQRGYLLSISSSFERITSQALNGMYADEFFGGFGEDTQGSQDFRRLRAVIRELNECFADAMDLRGCRRTIKDSSQNYDLEKERCKPYMENWSPEYVTRQALEQEISDQARKNRGIELPGNANQLLVGSLFRDQSKPWEEIAHLHLMNAWESVKYFVCLLLHNLTDEHTYSLIVGTVLAPELERMKEDLLKKLEELTRYTKRGHPLPVGKSFLLNIQKARTDRQLAALKQGLGLNEDALKLEDSFRKTFNTEGLEKVASRLQSSNNQFAAAEIIDQMQAYYDTSIVTFVDNVATLAIENCLLSPLEHIFNGQTVNNMDDQRIRDLAAEPSHVRKDRERLNQELEKLRAGLNTFNIFNTESSSLQRPPIFGKPVIGQPPSLAQGPLAWHRKQEHETKSPTNSTKRTPYAPPPTNTNTTATSTYTTSPSANSSLTAPVPPLFGRPPFAPKDIDTANTGQDKVIFGIRNASTQNQPRFTGGLFGPPPSKFVDGNTTKGSPALGKDATQTGFPSPPVFAGGFGSSSTPLNQNDLPSIFGSKDTNSKFDPAKAPSTVF